jgi:hypothetical protein
MLFEPLWVEINHRSYKLKRTGTQCVALPDGQYELTLRHYLRIKRATITVEDKDVEVSINRIVPEYIFILVPGILISIVIMLCVLYALSIISSFSIFVCLILSLSLNLAQLFFRGEKYFKITVCQK